MSDLLSLQTKCKSKNPETCRKHGKVAELRAAMEEAEQTLDLEAYFHHRKNLEATVGSILLEETKDFGLYENLFAEELQEATSTRKSIATQLMRMHRKGDYTGMDWKLFAKWAVQTRPSQSYGALLEARYICDNGYLKIGSSEERGDFMNLKTGAYSEFKVTAADDAERRSVNFVQIRPHHNLDDYHLVIVDKNTGVSELFIIGKDDMQEELDRVGQLAHGSQATNMNETKEYAIRFNASQTDALYKRWKTDYAKPFPFS